MCSGIKRYNLEIVEYFRTDLVFTTYKGGIVYPGNLTSTFKSVLKSGKLKDIRFHDLRHSIALICLQAGTDIKTLQKDLGLSSISTTLDSCGHVYDEILDLSVNS
jgi:site-specific recombinase XerD